MSFNVMIVDDSGAMRAVIKKVITLSGFKISTCVEAANGLEALEKLKQNWVDVIISDVNMPEMNGLELLQSLSQDPLYQNISPSVSSTGPGGSSWITWKRSGTRRPLPAKSRWRET
jgi:two-component system chemotaxis response regulator CheY